MASYRDIEKEHWLRKCNFTRKQISLGKLGTF